MKIEQLPPGRWPELTQAFKDSRSDEPLPKPEQSVMLAAFDGSELIGAIGAERVWLVSPLWVRRDYRGSGLTKALASRLCDFNEEKLRETCITTSDHVGKLVFSMGFVPLEGQLWRRDRGK